MTSQGGQLEECPSDLKRATQECCWCDLTGSTGKPEKADASCNLHSSSSSPSSRPIPAPVIGTRTGYRSRRFSAQNKTDGTTQSARTASSSGTQAQAAGEPPPGLEQHGNLVEVVSGGKPGVDLKAWRELTKFKPFTNVFVCDKKRGRILLGMKKRGFGKDMYNGFGGKVEPNESPMEAAVRELREESGISADLEECGVLLFVNASPEYCHYVHMYRAYEYEGEPVETEEMHPQWFAIPKEYLDFNPAFKELSSLSSSSASPPATPESEPLPSIPLERMWPDDELWMPLLLRGEYFVGRVDFGINNSDAQHGSWTMERWWLGTKAKE